RPVRFARATIEMAVDEPQAAKVDLEAILQREPNDPNAHFALAMVLRDKLDDVQAANVHFRRYLESRPNGANAEHARASLVPSVNPSFLTRSISRRFSDIWRRFARTWTTRRSARS